MRALCCLLCVAVASGSIRFLSLGDWGVDPYDLFDTSVNDQLRVRTIMDTYVAEYGADFILTAGDNFYPDGVRTVNSSRWDDAWKDVYNTTNLKDLVWYPSLGNHDHEPDMRGQNQVDRTLIDDKWILPYFYHDFYKVAGDIKLHMVVIDTELMTNPEHSPFHQVQQLDWLNDTLTNAELSDWTIVVGHHPYWSCGNSGVGNPWIWNNLLPILKFHNVDFAVSGHDHNLQHIVANDSSKPEFLITGGGGKGLDEFVPADCDGVHQRGYTSLTFELRHGFLNMNIEKNNLTAKFIGVDNLGFNGTEVDPIELYSYTAFK